MRTQPTLILTAPPAASGPDEAMDRFHPLLHALPHLLHSKLPLLLVCDEATATLAQSVLNRDDMLTIAFRSRHPADQQVEAMVEGLLARPHAPSWLLVPGGMPRLQPSTIEAIASALSRYPLAYAEYHQQSGMPLGFSSELFSELIHLSCYRDLERLRARYPAHAVEVDDPGVLMDPVRAQLSPEFSNAGAGPPSAGNGLPGLPRY